MSWKKGPLPVDTWNWGGVVPIEPNRHGLIAGGGFYFADFHGDHVLLEDDKKTRLEANEVAFYNNSIELPPHLNGMGKRLS